MIDCLGLGKNVSFTLDLSRSNLLRVAVLGSAGQLGRDLVSQLQSDQFFAAVLPLTREHMDLQKKESILSAVRELKADVLINCAAYNLVDHAEANPEIAFAVNAVGVKELAVACKSANIKLVQISTDFVFGADETRHSPISETTLPGPVSAYGISKLAGEQFALAASFRNLVVRTCGLYGVWGSGGKGGNFVETMLRIAGQGKPLRVVDDQRCTPSYTADVAAAIIELVQKDATQIFHVTNSQSCTWYQLAAEIFKLANINADLTAITSEQFNAAAKRPAYSVLSCDRLVSIGVQRPRPWQDALKEYMTERSKK